MNVALLGSGLIGGSIGLALKAAGAAVRIVVYDRDGDAATHAVERGAADETAPDPARAVENADVVFAATPVGVIPSVIEQALPGLRAGAIVTDVGSTKAGVVRAVEPLLPPGVSFIGGHPMAGSEEEGIAAARADLFDGAWWILTPTEHADAEAYRTLHGLLAEIGARVMALRPDEHDELLAFISHLPQLTATTLMNMAAERGRDHAGLLALAAGGFRDVTRIASSNPQIWVDVCRENRDAVAAALEQFAERLLAMRDLVRDDSADRLRESLERARAARRSLPEKLVEGDLFEVCMPVPDRPGVLAEVTTTVGNLGINIEDLEIQHATDGRRGTLRLAVVGRAQAAHVDTALRALGYEPWIAES